MASPTYNKAKGARAERDHCDWLRRNGFPHAEPRRLAGAHDRGDVTGIPGAVVEVKSGARVDLPGWLRELETEIRNVPSAQIGWLAVRLKGRPNPDDWAIVVPPWVLLTLLEQAGWIDDTESEEAD